MQNLIFRIIAAILSAGLVVWLFDFCHSQWDFYQFSLFRDITNVVQSWGLSIRHCLWAILSVILCITGLYRHVSRLFLFALIGTVVISCISIAIEAAEHML